MQMRLEQHHTLVAEETVARVQVTGEQSTLLRASDAADIWYFVSQYGNGAACPSTKLSHFLTVCLAFTHFSSISTWEAIEDAFSTPEPRWSDIKTKLAEAVRTRQKIFGGLFYGRTLRRYKWKQNGSWREAGKMGLPEREVVSLKLLHAAIPINAVDAYEADPNGTTFAEWYDSFTKNMRQTTVKLWGPFSMKAVLELLVCCGRVRDHHVSRWLAECECYTPALHELFGDALPSSERMKALYLIFYEMAMTHGGKLNFADVTMHLCWSDR